MSYQEFAPHPKLQEYIKCFWVLERDFRATNGAIDILPDSYMEMIFNIGSSCWIEDSPAPRELPPCYLANLLAKPFRLQSTGVLRTIGVRFYAWGFYPLMKVDRPLAGAIYPLGEWQHLQGHLRCAEGPRVKEILDAELAAYLPHAAAPTSVRCGLSRQLTQWRGDLQVRKFAEQCHLSPRQLERQLQQYAHIAPKTLARRLRFEQARDQLSRNPALDFSQLALDCGYADQAHLSREFKFFSNRTLRQFVGEISGIEEHLRCGVGFGVDCGVDCGVAGGKGAGADR